MPRTYVGNKERLRWNDVGPEGKRGPKLIFTYGQETERSHRSECGCPENMEVKLGQTRQRDHRRGQEGTSTEHTPLHRLHVRKQRVGPRPGQQGRDRKEAEGADWWDSMAGPCGTSAKADVRRKNMYGPGSESVHKIGIGRLGNEQQVLHGVPLNCRTGAT